MPRAMLTMKCLLVCCLALLLSGAQCAAQDNLPAQTASTSTSTELPACLYDQAQTVLVSGGATNTALRTRSVTAALKSADVATQRFVVVWTAASPTTTEGQDIYARLYSVTLNATAAESAEFRVNIATDLDQQNPQVATLPGGGFVVSWESVTLSPDSQAVFIGRQRRIRFQIFDWLGTRLGDEQDIAADEGDFPHLDARPAVSGIYVVSTGTSARFAMAWLRTYFSFSNATGSLPSALNPYTELADSGFTVPTSVTVVMTRIFLSDGRPLTKPARVNSGYPFDDTAGVAGSVSVATIQGDRYAVAWSDDTTCGGSRIFGQLFDGSDGQQIGSAFMVSGSATGSTEDHVDPAVVNVRTGGFVVSWTVQDTSGTGASTIRMQVFDGTAAKRGRPFGVGNASGAIQSASSMGAFTNGNFVVVWNAFESSGFRIYAQMFNSTDIGAKDPKQMVSADYDESFDGIPTSDSLPSVTILSGNQMVVAWNRNSIAVYAKAYTCARDCVLTAWSALSECSATCQQDGISFRMRDIVSEAILGGAECSFFQTTQYFPCVGTGCLTAGSVAAETLPAQNTTSTTVGPTISPYQNIRKLHAPAA